VLVVEEEEPTVLELLEQAELEAVVTVLMHRVEMVMLEQ
jgi:hypothetical protein